ncbi:hypothetical protein C8R45DRAFT_1107985 [Mycena sanguinolenta]|nr:hypothetical protein C8R45DRAFT_1107985 [Mycena sanguinolenta]
MAADVDEDADSMRLGRVERSAAWETASARFANTATVEKGKKLGAPVDVRTPSLPSISLLSASSLFLVSLPPSSPPSSCSYSPLRPHALPFLSLLPPIYQPPPQHLGDDLIPSARQPINYDMQMPALTSSCAVCECGDIYGWVGVTVAAELPASRVLELVPSLPSRRASLRPSLPSPCFLLSLSCPPCHALSPCVPSLTRSPLSPCPSLSFSPRTAYPSAY